MSVARAAATSTGPVPDPAGRLDPEPTFVWVDGLAEPVVAVVAVPAHDPAEYYELVSITAVAIPAGSPEPADANEWMASAYPKATADASGLSAGGNLQLAIPGIPDGMVAIQLILGLAE